MTFIDPKLIELEETKLSNCNVDLYSQEDLDITNHHRISDIGVGDINDTYNTSLITSYDMYNNESFYERSDPDESYIVSNASCSNKKPLEYKVMVLSADTFGDSTMAVTLKYRPEKLITRIQYQIVNKNNKTRMSLATNGGDNGNIGNIGNIGNDMGPIGNDISNQIYPLVGDENSQPPVLCAKPSIIYSSKLTIAQLSVVLSTDIITTQLVQQDILYIISNYCNFPVGYQTWTRGTLESQKQAILGVLKRVFIDIYPFLNETKLNILLKRGTYVLIQRRKRKQQRVLQNVHMNGLE